MRFHTSLDPFVSMPVACASATLYVLLVLLGKNLMANRTSLKMRSAKILYNVVQIIVCGFTFWRLLPYFTLAEHGYGIGLPHNSEVELLVFFYYCCKILDFCDTAFIVLEKKDAQLSILHVWHHASLVPLFAYYLTMGMGGGPVATLPFYNSLVHVLMYAHYLYMSLVPKARPWWKQILTTSQIGHQVLCMIYMIINGYYGYVPRGVAVIGMLWGSSIVLLFASFYWTSYMKRSGSASMGSSDSALGVCLVVLVAVCAYSMNAL